MSRRHLVIAGSVVLFHAAALWALQSGLMRRAVELVVPVSMVSEIITPPAPKVEPPSPVPAPAPAPKPVARQPERPRPAPPAPRPVAIPDPSPAPNAPTGVQQPQPPAPPIAAPVAAAPAPAPAAPARVELPSTSADYLQNPAPVYPAMSKRLGEQGTVIVRVLIGADGAPQQAEVKRSSGFERLDRAAVNYVMVCRYVPGKVGGVPQTMWYDAPVKYNLD